MSLTFIEHWLVTSWADIATFIVSIGGGITFLATLWKWRTDYTRDLRKQRFELYYKLRSQYETFVPIFEALDHYAEAKTQEEKNKAEAEVRALDTNVREQFAAFLENVALLAQSKIINYRLANYEFGHYALLCWDTPPFWDDPFDKQDHPYWALLKAFIDNIRVYQHELFNERTKTVSKIRL
jgi:hypothetical protein